MRACVAGIRTGRPSQDLPPTGIGSRHVETRMQMPPPNEPTLGMSRNLDSLLLCTCTRRCRSFSSKLWKLRGSSKICDPNTSGAHPMTTRMRMPLPNKPALGMSRDFDSLFFCTCTRRCRSFSSKLQKMVIFYVLVPDLWCPPYISL
jgi:hypothetical protein